MFGRHIFFLVNRVIIKERCLRIFAVRMYFSLNIKAEQNFLIPGSNLSLLDTIAQGSTRACDLVRRNS
jgi:hypothetical protein